VAGVELVGRDQRIAGFQPQNLQSFDAGLILDLPHHRVSNALAARLVRHEHRFHFPEAVLDRKRTRTDQRVALACDEEPDIGGGQLFNIEIEVVLLWKQALHQRVA